MNSPKAVVVEDLGDDATDEQKQAYEMLEKKFEDLPPGHFGIYQNSTGKMFDVGTLDNVAGSVLFEDDQTQDLDRGVTHSVKFHSLINMMNAEPDINQGLNLKSELSSGYGYRFRYPDLPPELSVKSPITRLSIPYWNLWAKFVNYDHSLRQQIHSNYGMGNVWTEKIYDKAGMNNRGWGIRKLIVRSPDTMYNVVDGKGNILYFVQSAIETDRVFGSNFTIRHDKMNDFTSKLKQKHTDFDKTRDLLKIPRHKIMYYNYNAFYDDTVYGFGAGVPLVSYARSKIGIQKRILRLIDNASSSLLVFKYGDKDFMVSGKAANKIFGKIKTRKALKMVLLPWYFDVEEKELGKNMGNFEPYMQYFANQESNGIGIPPFATGRGGSAEGATLQMELLVRQLMYMQKVIANHQATQLFPEVIVGDPTRSRHIPTQSVEEVEKILKESKDKHVISSIYPYIAPNVFMNIPSLSWNIMETIQDKRLRHEVYLRNGVVSEEEVREELDYSGTVADEKQNLLLRLEIEKVALEREKIKSQERMAEQQAKVAKATKSDSSSSSSE
jgi:hypothetical protein